MRMEFEPTSLLVRCDTRLSLKKLEHWLNQKGYSLGQPVIPSGTLKKALDNGKLEEICMAVQVEGRYGKIQTKQAPRTATGPDFKKLFVGSGGIFKICEATLRVVSIPEKKQPLLLRWKETKNQAHFLHRLAGSGIHATLTQRVGGLKIQLSGMKELVTAEAKTLKKLVRETNGKIL